MREVSFKPRPKMATVSLVVSLWFRAVSLFSPGFSNWFRYLMRAFDAFFELLTRGQFFY